MSVTYGFYNSLNHDRKYNTIQISKMFDGIIKDGIFMSIGNHFTVSAGTGMVVNVDTGKAWFNHTWTENDSILPVDVDQSEVVLNRIDSLILEVNSSTRINEIKFLKGTPSSTPVAPALTNNNMLHQYLLCTVTIPAGVTAITGSMIQSYIGMGDTPFVSGVLETVDLNTLLGQWQASLTEFISNETSEFITWFDAMKNQLTTDAAGNLQLQIDELEENKLNKTGASNYNTVVFTEESGDTNIITGETHAILFGKIKRAITNLSNKIRNGSTGDILYIIYYTFSGNVISGSTVDFGVVIIPAGKIFVGMVVTPRATVPIIMTHYNNHVFAHSLSYTGPIYYDCVLLVK